MNQTNATTPLPLRKVKLLFSFIFIFKYIWQWANVHGWGRVGPLEQRQSCQTVLYKDAVRTIWSSQQRISPEPVFVNLLRSRGIDSQPVGPIRQPSLSYRPARLHKLAASVPRNLFLGFVNVYKYGLWQIRQVRSVYHSPLYLCATLGWDGEREKGK